MNGRVYDALLGRMISADPLRAIRIEYATTDYRAAPDFQIQDVTSGTSFASNIFAWEEREFSAQQHNRYSYVDNLPLTFRDPSGFTPDEPGVVPTFIPLMASLFDRPVHMEDGGGGGGGYGGSADGSGSQGGKFVSRGAAIGATVGIVGSLILGPGFLLADLAFFGMLGALSGASGGAVACIWWCDDEDSKP